MSGKQEISKKIFALPVWDTHNHLDGSAKLAAQTFWDMGHYFWFCRELKAVGYPDNPDELDEPERASAFIQALDKARNTNWNLLFRQSIKDLFDVDLKTEADIFAINDKLLTTRNDPTWAAEVCRRAGIRKLTITPTYKQNGLEEIKDLHFYYSWMDVGSGKLVKRVLEADDQAAAAANVISELKKKTDGLVAQGIRVIRAPLPMSTTAEGTCTDEVTLTSTGNTEWQITQYLGHEAYKIFDAEKFHVQVFVGMEPFEDSYKDRRTKAHRICAKNDTHRFHDIANLFDMYCDVTFEFMNAAELSSLDIVQMARVFRNVTPGGLWWFSFRRSVYHANMQYRAEALPACRSTFLATDARCIEWAYIKTMLVKRFMAEFFHKQIEDGWMDEETALATAKWWLHDSAARLYPA